MPVQQLPEQLLLTLFNRFPARESIFKDPESRAPEEYAAESDPDSFINHFEPFPELFAGADVLDLGSGFGGRTVKFLEYGAKSVVGLEVTQEMVHHGEDFARERGVADRVSFVLGTGEQIPCPDESFDLIAMMDVMEHVVDPDQVLSECSRVLRPGGRLALVFPPYYDLTQGSHLHGYATRVPGLNLLFPTSTLRRATRQLVEQKGVSYERFFRDVPTDKLPNQNGLTVRGFRRAVRQSPLEADWIYCMGHLQYRRLQESGSLFGSAKPAYRAAQIAAEVPLLQEATCSRVCSVLRKPRSRA
jgi:SAM-dependent methyltransferase